MHFRPMGVLEPSPPPLPATLLRLHVVSGEGEFILYIAETFILETSVLMYTGIINLCLGNG